MHRWPHGAKGLLLAATAVPFLLGLIAFAAFVVTLLQDNVTPPASLNVALVTFAVSVLLVYGCAVAYVVDLLAGRRVRGAAPRTWWTAALLLAPVLAGPAYWWLYVRPAATQPFGPQILTPAREWAPGRKGLTGAACAFMPLFMVVWMRFVDSVGLDPDPDLLATMFALFSTWMIATGATLTLFVLDAVRAGGGRAIVWGIALAALGIVLAPVYWWLNVRPSAGGPATP